MKAKSPLKIAFIGFRHQHIMSVYNHAEMHADAWEIVGACEEDEATRQNLASKGRVKITHQDHVGMLDSVDCDVVAVGDYYAKRGSLIIAALRRGKHVISDKPICTDLAELRKIEELTKTSGLKVGCLLTIRANGNFRRAHKSVRGGLIGEVLAVAVNGQHPLNIGIRPAWYFEKGKQGGTINDLGIHFFDFIPWVTGVDFAEVVAARTWNAKAPEFPDFQTGAQVMLRMRNNAGVMADVSYFALEKFSGAKPHSWRFTLFGSEGVLETGSSPVSYNGCVLARNGQSAEEILPPIPLPDGENIMRGFEREIRGEANGVTASTAEVLNASRVALLVQDSADKHKTGVDLPGFSG